VIGSVPVTIATSVGAVVIAFLSFIYVVFNGARQAKSTGESLLFVRIDDLEGQIESLRSENKECERRCEDLRKSNIELLTRVVKLEKNGDPYQGPGGYYRSE
jgi:hypothetical protein